ncbi:MAG: ABC transporter permease [Eubacteriales bacterium]|nr:ABC transporter permease [Clostridiales bacterium]MDD6372216.1 ABC transporter permease [Eubacteriales bacterium]MDD7260490.1 ABC transporter permease [Eubacteriales bacterium]MDY6067064.1 ABC transporter permease [Candidatus Faecousia sp.]
MLENIHLAFEGIWSHKLRSILTMLGIIIGIAAIITIVSTIKGTNEQIKENLIGAGNNVVSVQLNQNGNEYDLSWSPLPDTVRVISEETRQALEDINGAEEVSLYYSRSYTDGFFYLDTPFNGNVLGVDRHYFSTYGMQIRAGRGFTEKDYTEFRKVALVDSTAAKSLFSGVDPVGREIEFGSDVYTVVGVIGPAEEFTPTINSLNDYYLYANDGSGSIYFPDSLWPALYQFDEPQSVAIKVKNTDVMASVGKKAADLLTGSQIIGTDTGFDYRSADMLEQAQQLQNMSKSTNTQLVWIASISLLVGGIGVMNIMLVSVTERTSEIGLKKALGAKKKRILLQFLTEAAVLTSIGGIIGVLTGIGLAELISGLMQIPVAISAPAIIIAVVFSTLIGVIFGLLPATKAANLNPIDALRRV